MKFKTYYTDNSSKGEINEKPSLTVPNQSMTVEEIIQRFTSGTPLPVGKSVYYDENIDPTLDPAFDLSDATEIINNISERIEQKKEEDERVKRNKDDDEKTKKSENTDNQEHAAKGETDS